MTMGCSLPIITVTFFLVLILQQQVADGRLNQKTKCPPWCITRVDAPDDRIKMSLDWICNNGADCGPIRPGGPCYMKGDLRAISSYAFNDYFQKTRVSGGLCDYGQVATLTHADPSYGACKYTCTPYR